MKVLIAGATGLVGQQLLHGLLADASVEVVWSVARRQLPDHPKLVQLISEVSDWPHLVASVNPDIVVLALGTTINQAGSEEAFAAIDLDAVLAVAGAGAGAGAKQVLLVSSIGAHAASRNFYLSIKGKAEMGLQAIGFDRIDIFRPGLLRGKRSGPKRPGEALAMRVSPVTDFLTPRVLDHYRSIDSAAVARAMQAAMGSAGSGTHIHDNRAILELAG